MILEYIVTMILYVSDAVCRQFQSTVVTSKMSITVECIKQSNCETENIPTERASCVELAVNKAQWGGLCDQTDHLAGGRDCKRKRNNKLILLSPVL